MFFKNSTNTSISDSDRISPFSHKNFLRPITDMYEFFDPSEVFPISAWYASNASRSSSSIFYSLGLLTSMQTKSEKVTVLLLFWDLKSSIIYFSYFYVGQCPRPRMYMPTDVIGIYPSSVLSKKENSSWYVFNYYGSSASRIYEESIFYLIK